MTQHISLKKSIVLLSKNWKNSLFVLSADILFALLMLGLRFVLVNLNTRVIDALYHSSGNMQILVPYAAVALEIILLFLIYSFFKFVVIKLIKNYFHIAGNENFFTFLKINTAAFLELIIIASLYVLLTYNIFNGLIPSAAQNPVRFMVTVASVALLGFILFLYMYILLNLQHFIGTVKGKFWKNILASFRKTISIRTYRTLWENLKIVSIAALVLFVLYILALAFGWTKYAGMFKTIAIFLSAIAFYFAHFINRLNFSLMGGEINV